MLRSRIPANPPYRQLLPSSDNLSEDESLVFQALCRSGVQETRIALQRKTGLRGHEIVRALRSLDRLGLVVRVGARWVVGPEVDRNLKIDPPPVARPEAQKPTPERPQSIEPSVPEREERQTDWSAFRSLCRYYIECLEFETGGSIELKTEGVGGSFVECHQIINWGVLAAGGKVELSTTPEIFGLLTRTRRSSSSSRLRLGAPIERVSGKRGGEDVLIPVFLQTVTVMRGRNQITLTGEGPPKVNEAWLRSRYPASRADQREDLLIQLGLFFEQEGVDGAEVVPRDGATIQSLWQSLFQAFGDHFLEPGGPDRPQSQPAIEATRLKGIYNRVVVISATDSTFVGGVLEELRLLAKCGDAELRGTALAPFFDPKWVAMRKDAKPKQSRMRPEFQPLNYEQREVVGLSFDTPVLAVQGPPGTGKSTVVTHVLAGHALAGETVLFASRNHRAIEAVVPRLQAIHPDKPLVLRLTKSLGDAEAGNDDWLEEILKLLGHPAGDDSKGALDALRARLESELASRDQIEQSIVSQLVLADELSQLENSILEVERGQIGRAHV